jgi:antitoxin PrlF
MESTMTSRGRLTIPKEIRNHLGLKPGSRVKFFVRPDGTVVLLPRRPLKALRGMLKSWRQGPVSLAEMNEAIAKGATE